ncbi:hypothetical protein ACFVX3_19245 [Rhodococcus erythropolis]
MTVNTFGWTRRGSVSDDMKKMLDVHPLRVPSSMPDIGPSAGARTLLKAGNGPAFTSAAYPPSCAEDRTVTHCSETSIRGETPARSVLLLSPFAVA